MSSSPSLSGKDGEGSMEQSDPLPSVKFTFDIDPMNIEISERKRPFYEFLTSLCAIVGGVFAMFGLLDG